MTNTTALIIGVVAPISVILGGLIIFIIRTERRRKKESTLITSQPPRPRHHSYIFGNRRNGNTRLGSGANQVEDGIEVCGIIPAGTFAFNDKKSALELESTSDTHRIQLQRGEGEGFGITRHTEVEVRSDSKVQDFAAVQHTSATPFLVELPERPFPRESYRLSRPHDRPQLPPTELPEQPYTRESNRLSRAQTEISQPQPQRPRSQLLSPEEGQKPRPLFTYKVADRTSPSLPPLPTSRESTRSRGSGGGSGARRAEVGCDSPTISRIDGVVSPEAGEQSPRHLVSPPLPIQDLQQRWRNSEHIVASPPVRNIFPIPPRPVSLQDGFDLSREGDGDWEVRRPERVVRRDTRAQEREREQDIDESF